MNNEIILVFETTNTENYWLKYIANYIHEKGINIKCNYILKYIEISEYKICFTTRYILKNFLIGRHNAKVIDMAEARLEKDFKGTLKEIFYE
jgi:hypothetical protein